MYTSDSGIAGTYVPNMSKEDDKRLCDYWGFYRCPMAEECSRECVAHDIYVEGLRDGDSDYDH